jgi:hypothetical protein
VSRVVTMQITEECDGCGQRYQFSNKDAAGDFYRLEPRPLTVAKIRDEARYGLPIESESTRHFCSLRCLQAWLAKQQIPQES